MQRISINSFAVSFSIYTSKMASFLNWPLLIPLILTFTSTNANLLIPGIMSEQVELSLNSQEFVGFLQSALNGTEVELRLRCDAEVNVAFDVQFVARSSPCSKEFFVDKSRFNQVSNLLVSHLS